MPSALRAILTCMQELYDPIAITMPKAFREGEARMRAVESFYGISKVEKISGISYVDQACIFSKVC